MIVLSIGTERKLFSQNPTRDRVLGMGKSFEQYHLVVFSLAKDNFKQETVGSAIIYPTNSFSKLFYVWDAISITRKIAKKLSREEKQKTVVSVQDPFECGIAGLVISKMFKIGLHVQVHVDLYAKYFHNTMLQKIRSIIAPLVIRNAGTIRCDSVRMKKGILERNLSHAPIEVLPIYIDVKKYDRTISATLDIHTMFSEHRTVFLMASRLEAEKDIAHTMQVFDRVAKKYPNKIGLVIVGSGSLEKKLCEQVASLGAEEDVKLVPWTNDLQSYYKTADVFMITSLFEGYGLTIAESLLCGTPVLATDVGVAPEIITPGQNGWMYPPADYECLQQCLEAIAEDPMGTATQAKEYLIAHPYVHAYGDAGKYQEIFVNNIKSALK